MFWPSDSGLSTLDFLRHRSKCTVSWEALFFGRPRGADGGVLRAESQTDFTKMAFAAS